MALTTGNLAKKAQRLEYEPGNQRFDAGEKLAPTSAGLGLIDETSS